MIYACVVCTNTHTFPCGRNTLRRTHLFESGSAVRSPGVLLLSLFVCELICRSVTRAFAYTQIQFRNRVVVLLICVHDQRSVNRYRVIGIVCPPDSLERKKNVVGEKTRRYAAKLYAKNLLLMAVRFVIGLYVVGHHVSVLISNALVTCERTGSVFFLLIQ